MASYHGYYQARDPRYLYEKTRNPLEIIKVPNADESTIMGYLQANSGFSVFLYLVEKSGLYTELSDPRSHYTLFAVPDSQINLGMCDLNNLDKTEARKIVLHSLLDGVHMYRDIRSDGDMFLKTKLQNSRIYVRNDNFNTYIDDRAQVIKFDILKCNGVIHLVSDLVFPSTPLT